MHLDAQLLEPKLALAGAVTTRAISVVSPAAGSYNAGDDLVFRVTFNAPVTISDEPALNLVIGKTTVPASYIGGSGTNTLSFHHLVTPGENDANGITLARTMTGSLTDDSNRLVRLGLPSTRFPKVLIDTAAPVVLSVASPADRTYIPGDAVSFVVKWSEKVFASGPLTLPVTIGNVTRKAMWDGSGSGTRSLVFTTKVELGDTAPAGVSVVGPIGFGSSGVLGDTAGNTADPAAAAVAFPRVIVDGIGPSVTSFGNTVVTTSQVSMQVSFTEPVTITGRPYIPITVDGVARQLVAARGPGRKTVLFSYRPLGRERLKPDNVIIPSQAIVVPTGAAILDRAGNRAESIAKPTEVAISSDLIVENNTIGEVVGTIKTNVGDGVRDRFAFTLLTSGDGADDYASFRIVGSSLVAAEVFDYERKSEYSIRVRATSAGGLNAEQVFTVKVGDVAATRPRLVDGWLDGAVVYADTNENGKRDWQDLSGNDKWDPGEGEPWTMSLEDGVVPQNFEFGSGTLRTFGGFDVDSCVPFVGELAAPAGSSVINPLTTLIVALMHKQFSLDRANEAATELTGYLINYCSYDPVSVLKGDPEDEAALKVQKVAAQIANLLAASTRTCGISQASVNLADVVGVTNGASVDLSNVDTVHHILEPSPHDDELVVSLAGINHKIRTAASYGLVARAQFEAQSLLMPAPEGTTGSVDGLHYRVFATGVSITGYDGPGGVVVIPAEIVGKPVTIIGTSAFSGRTDLLGVTIPGSVTAIKSWAFYGCTGLQSVAIGEGVQTIERHAFWGCTALRSMTIPGSMTVIKDHAFYGCVALESIVVDALNNAYSSREGVLYDKNQTALLFCPYATAGVISVPSTVATIGDYAFSSCRALQGVLIPDTVTAIGDYAFSSCGALQEVSIPNTVTTIGAFAFAYCSGLKEVAIPGSVTAVGESAFFCCTGLEIARIADGVTTIGNFAFYWCTQLESVTIPGSVTSIGNYAFWFCIGLASVTIPDSVTTIGNGTFSACISLTSVTIPSSVTMIGDHAFDFCAGLTSLTIAPSVTRIGKYAFYWCTGLTSVTIPSSVMTLGQGVFSGCTGLADVTILGSISAISDRAFEGCGLTSVTIPDSVTTIGNWAFYFCTGLTGVTIPDSVTTIGYGAFQRCSGLSSIRIGGGVQAIGDFAFDSCTSLTTVKMPGSLRTIGTNAFSGCTGLTNVTIPDSVTTIGNGAFYLCSGLTSVVIRGNLTTIGGYAFAGCTGLVTLRCYGGPPVLVGDFTNQGITATVNYPSGNMAWAPYVNTTFGGLATASFSGGIANEPPTGVAIENALTSLLDSTDTSPGIKLADIVISDDGLGRNEIALSGDDAEAFAVIDGELYLRQGERLSAATKSSYSVTVMVSDQGFPDVPAVTADYVLAIEDGETGTMGGFRYQESASGVTITSYEGPGGALVIPEAVSGKPVISIGVQAFYNCVGLTTVTIPGSVTTIGEWAFAGCSGLTSVTISEGVRTIGNNAFYSCAGLLSVVIPRTVVTIGSGAFRGCSGLASAVIGDGVEVIGIFAFDRCTGLASVTIPDSVTTIGIGAFFYCTGLTHVTIPGSVATIGNNAFSFCRGLTSVTISDGVQTIGNGTFLYCISLTNVTLPESVATIKAWAFAGCSGLLTLRFLGGPPTLVGDFTKQGISALVNYPSDNMAWAPFANARFGGLITVPS